MSFTLGLELPLACLYRRQQTDTVQPCEELQLCQRALLAQQRLALA